MAKRVTTEHVADVETGELSGVGTVLNKKSSQCSLNESVLIPIWATLNKVSHCLVQRQRHLRLKANDVVALNQFRRCFDSTPMTSQASKYRCLRSVASGSAGPTPNLE